MKRIGVLMALLLIVGAIVLGIYLVSRWVDRHNVQQVEAKLAELTAACEAAEDSYRSWRQHVNFTWHGTQESYWRVNRFRLGDLVLPDETLGIDRLCGRQKNLMDAWVDPKVVYEDAESLISDLRLLVESPLAELRLAEEVLSQLEEVRLWAYFDVYYIVYGPAIPSAILAFSNGESHLDSAWDSMAGSNWGLARMSTNAARKDFCFAISASGRTTPRTERMCVSP